MGKVTIVAGKSSSYGKNIVGDTSKKISKVAAKHVEKLEKHMKMALDSATTKESKKLKAIQMRQQNQILKSILKLGEELRAILDAYESLLLDCLESKSFLRQESCPFDIRYEKAKEDDIKAAEKILDLLERIKLNIKFIDTAVGEYLEFDDLLGKTDVKQYTFYAKYITAIKKLMETDDNVLKFDWYHVKGKDKFKNFDKVKSIFEKLAKNYMYLKETCNSAIDCLYAKLAKPWNTYKEDINTLLDGGLGFIAGQDIQEKQQIKKIRKALQKIQKVQQPSLAAEPVKKQKQKFLRRLHKLSLQQMDK